MATADFPCETPKEGLPGPGKPAPYSSPDFPFMDDFTPPQTPASGTQRGSATSKRGAPSPRSPSRESQYSQSAPQYTPPAPPMSPRSVDNPMYSTPREEGFSTPTYAARAPYVSPDFPFMDDYTPPPTPVSATPRRSATPKRGTPTPPSPSRDSQYSLSPPKYTPPPPPISPGFRTPDNRVSPPAPTTPLFTYSPESSDESTPSSSPRYPYGSPDFRFIDDFVTPPQTPPSRQSRRPSPRISFPPPPGYPPEMSPEARTPRGSPQPPSPFTFPGSSIGSSQQLSPLDSQGSPAETSGSWPTIHADHNFASTNIMSLSDYSFQDFVKSKEKVLVFFYDANQPRNSNVENEFSTAAGNRLHPLYGFAAVDCFYDQDLCDRQNITKLPMFKLFSNGFELSSIGDIEVFNANQMHQLMKMTPILNQPRAEIGKQFQERTDAAPKATKRRSFFSCI